MWLFLDVCATTKTKDRGRDKSYQSASNVHPTKKHNLYREQTLDDGDDDDFFGTATGGHHHRKH